MNIGHRQQSVRWNCDKKNCSHTNVRYIFIGDVIYDDKCDGCGRTIHEPLTKVLKESNK